MIISRQHALRLIASGKATIDGLYRPAHPCDVGLRHHYVTVTRHDIQRVDHYSPTEGELDRLERSEVE